ncbi:sulfatase family protein [Runella salmonicolor]|uniref:Arylsulfatase n=1 Tax=Runella salmonicolor TaxID=2950278 RepID=A0ABT1FKS6_9BACT|nr:arylsulfatase [Runella salmonicolor]MCP1381138.1 arylsulfatase [Runella salmonicolor]
MKLRTSLFISSWVLIGLLGFKSYFSGNEIKKGEVSTSPPPNIIVILADDLGYGDLQCYNPDSQIPTPHLNQLSQTGLRFTDAHSGSSVCSPTRYGLLTGRYAFRSPLKKGVLGGFSPPLIENERFTIADLLKNAGYQTAVIGKWHLGLEWPLQNGATPPPRSEPDVWPTGDGLNIQADLTQGPNDLGFDYSYIIPSSLDIPPYLYLENGKPTEREIVELAGNNEPRGVFWRTGPAGKGFKVENTLDILGQKAQQYMTEMRKQKKPFFLYLPLTSPHTPWVPSKEFRAKSNAGIYGDFVMHTDFVVGEVLAKLEALGLKENTLVIFTSDNGADWKPGDKEKFPKHRANYGYRGQKSDVWEGGHRVPFLVSWPQAIHTTRTLAHTLCLTDLMATFASLTHQKLPSNAGQDSFDFSKLLTTSPTKKPVRPSIIHHSIDGMFAIRSGKWKYIDGAGSGGWSKGPANDRKPALSAQLYDLEKDPGETNNLMNTYPKIAANLQTLLRQQQQNGYTRNGAKK